MKIGIITQPLFANYGGFLQNYALQQVLKRLGHEPITIDYFRYRKLWIYLLYILKLIILRLIRGKGFEAIPQLRRRSCNNESFVNNYLSVTKPVGSYKNNIIEEYNLGTIIVGSDQVWRPRYNSLILKDVFLDFVLQKGVKKIAYAASFGTDEWEYTSKQTKECSILAKQFQAISVRENSGVELCKKYLDVEAIEVLDPTLLLDKEDYTELCKDVPANSEQYLAAYVLDINDKKSEFIQKIVNEQQLPLKIFSAGNTSKLTIEEWLAMFRDAQYIITDSFHGTVFSIIFNKPFISIGNGKRGMSRFLSLLDKFGLESRLFDEILLEKYSYVENKIDWENINNQRIKLKTLSLNFLVNNLNID